MMIETMIEQMKALVCDVPYLYTNLANISALIYNGMDNINWAGFYLWRDEALILGPFQGKPACVRIERGMGVCGTALETGKTQLVRDVHDFPGHIACDAASNSELVVPIRSGDRIVGVLDIDSPVTGRFTIADMVEMEKLVSALEELLADQFSQI